MDLNIVFNLLLKTLLVYFFILLIMKFMGKREIGQLSLFDFVVLLLIADVSVVCIDGTRSLKETLILLTPVITLAVVQKCIAFILLKIPSLRGFFDDKESIIIDDGYLNLKELKKQRFNIDDLIPILRLKNIISFSEVQYMFIEANGDISIFKYQRSNTMNIKSSSNNSKLLGSQKLGLIGSSEYKSSIFPVIISGYFKDENIKRLNISKEFINKEIRRQGYKSEKEIYYGTIENGKLFILKTK